MTRIIGIVSGKGGVGKTTVALNIGTVLAKKYKKDVIIVDGNMTTSHLGLYMGMYYYPISLNHVLSGEVVIDKAMYDYSIPGVRIIPASLSLDDLKGMDVSEMKKHVKELFGKADFVILDGAPGFGREAMATIRASDEVLFVMTPFVPPLMDVIKCYQVAEELGVRSLGVVLNMTGEGRHELGKQEVEQLIELPVISMIPRDKEVLRSLSAKLPVTDMSPNTKSSRELDRLAAYIAGEYYTPPGMVSRLSGLFRRPKA